MFSIGRNRRQEPGSTLSVGSSVGVHCDRAHSRRLRTSLVMRWVLGFVAISALAACDDDQVSLSPVSSASASVTTAQTQQVVVTHPAPLVTLVASPTTVSSHGSSTLIWNATHAEQCTAIGGWHGQVATSGKWSTGSLSNSTEYELACKGAGGFATQSVTVTVSAPAPAVTIQASPSSLRSGGSSILTWSSQNSTSCAASGDWSGTKAVSGSQSTGPIKDNSTFTLTCKGSGGSAVQSATVSVNSSAPTVNISASPSTLAAGASSTLTWSSANATACTASGGWSGSKATSGTTSTGALTSGATYTLTCTGSGGSAVQSTTVSVKAPLPTVTLSVGPSAVTSGASATLTWSSTHATACSASGGWSGNKALSGSQSTGALTANATYILSCTGTGGNATQTATVSVKASAPTVSLSASPSSITRGSAATLTWSSTHATACTASGAWSGAKALSGSSSTGALTANATYSVTCTGTGGTAVQSATVTVAAAPTAIVTLSASPSTIASGAASTLTWSSSNATSCSASGGWSGSKAISGSQSTGALKANATYSLTCTGSGGGATQSTTVSVTQAAPTVAVAASPSTVASGNSAVLTWSSTNATACTASGAWSGAKAISGSQSTGVLKASAAYSLTCTGAGGSAVQAVTVSVTSATPAPTVTFAVNPSSIVSGTSSTLIWSTTNATACTASGAWSGTKAISGSQSTGALKASATYSLTCTGTGGSAAQSATVTVTSAAPTVSFSASPSTVASGGGSTLSWTSTNATSCTASGGWSGAEAMSGSHSTGALTANTSYTLTCTGSGGSAAQTATVTVTAAAPTVTLSANPTTVASGGTSTLKWSSTNASSCVASGGASGTEPTSGSQTTAAVMATTKYTLTCSGAGGSAAQSAMVSVTGSAGSGKSTIPNVTALPGNSPGPDTAGYTALGIGSKAAGFSWNDTVTGVKTWKLTAAGTPSSSSYFPWYSSGGLEISLPWGPNLDQYHIAFIDVGGNGYVCDFGLSTSATPGPYNYRALPSGSYAALVSAFSRLSPHVMYLLTGGHMRLYNVETAAYVDSQAASYGYSSSWPSTGWPVSNFSWLTVNAAETWAFGNGGGSFQALNLTNGTQISWKPSVVDDTYGGYGDSVTGDEQSQIWQVGSNTFQATTPAFTSANGWLGSELTSHGASMRGYWVYFNTDGSDTHPMPAGIIDQTTGASTIGSQSSAPYAPKYWGEYHLSGHWWLQNPGTDQYLLQSNWDTSSAAPGPASEQYALTLINPWAGTGYRLGFSYSNYITIGSISSYWAQPHATISHDGKLVIFGSNMLGSSRIDLFGMEVPVTAGTAPAFP